ncbi:uncharacterized protein LOC110163452 [Boleophthalmus pectinirostris]|uniref:uncharacterized protein LOC110163452 n=1 Tax=Boleophthalmus pectinirostris TaxID=150288 RepID=UPI000A1C6683|nr:uncharacterized protein LOC110163452 [Boleophthalmus pectinirostris]
MRSCLLTISLITACLDNSQGACSSYGCFICKETDKTCKTCTYVPSECTFSEVQDQRVCLCGNVSLSDCYRTSPQKTQQGGQWKTTVAIVVPICGVAVLLGLAVFFLKKRHNLRNSTTPENTEVHQYDNPRELPLRPNSGTAINTIYVTSTTLPTGDSAGPSSISPTYATLTSTTTATGTSTTPPPTTTSTIDTGTTTVYFTVNHSTSGNAETENTNVSKTTISDGNSAGVIYSGVKNPDEDTER